MASERWTKKKRQQFDDLMSFAPKTQELTWDQVDHLSEERLWWIMRRFDRGDLMVLLARAAAKAPVELLESIFEYYCFPGELGETADHAEPVKLEKRPTQEGLLKKLAELLFPRLGG